MITFCTPNRTSWRWTVSSLDVHLAFVLGSQSGRELMDGVSGSMYYGLCTAV